MENTNKNTESQPVIGAVWKKIGRNNTEFISGAIKIDGKDRSFIGFKNRNKKGANSPDYFLHTSRKDTPASKEKDKDKEIETDGKERGVEV